MGNRSHPRPRYGDQTLTPADLDRIAAYCAEAEGKEDIGALFDEDLLEFGGFAYGDLPALVEAHRRLLAVAGRMAVAIRGFSYWGEDGGRGIFCAGCDLEMPSDPHDEDCAQARKALAEYAALVKGETP